MISSKSSVQASCFIFFFSWKVSCTTCSVSISKKRPQEQMEQSEARKTPVGRNQRWLRCCRLAPVAAWCNKHFPLHPKPQALYISTSSFRQHGSSDPALFHYSVIWMSRTTLQASPLQGFTPWPCRGRGRGLQSPGETQLDQYPLSNQLFLVSFDISNGGFGLFCNV